MCLPMIEGHQVSEEQDIHTTTSPSPVVFPQPGVPSCPSTFASPLPFLVPPSLPSSPATLFTMHDSASLPAAGDMPFPSEGSTSNSEVFAPRRNPVRIARPLAHPLVEDDQEDSRLLKRAKTAREPQKPEKSGKLKLEKISGQSYRLKSGVADKLHPRVPCGPCPFPGCQKKLVDKNPGALSKHLQTHLPRGLLASPTQRTTCPDKHCPLKPWSGKGNTFVRHIRTDHYEDRWLCPLHTEKCTAHITRRGDILLHLERTHPDRYFEFVEAVRGP